MKSAIDRSVSVVVLAKLRALAPLHHSRSARGEKANGSELLVEGMLLPREGQRPENIKETELGTKAEGPAEGQREWAGNGAILASCQAGRGTGG